VLVAAAVLPHPPLLVPELARGASPELDEMRVRCRSAVDVVAAAAADVTFVVGADTGLRATTLRPWGVDVAVDVPEPLPLAVLLGAWLTAGTQRSFVAVDAELAPAECAAIGADLAAAAGRVALVVMGDGSARRDVKAPGYLDPRATVYDDEVSRALAAADGPALLALDPTLADELLVAGRAPWQVLAGAAAGRTWDRRTAWFGAPHGVGYHVVTWSEAGSAVASANVGR
jgi:hypothetical protein